MTVHGLVGHDSHKLTSNDACATVEVCCTRVQIAAGRDCDCGPHGLMRQRTLSDARSSCGDLKCSPEMPAEETGDGREDRSRLRRRFGRRYRSRSSGVGQNEPTPARPHRGMIGAPDGRHPIRAQAAGPQAVGRRGSDFGFPTFFDLKMEVTPSELSDMAAPPI